MGGHRKIDIFFFFFFGVCVWGGGGRRRRHIIWDEIENINCGKGGGGGEMLENTNRKTEGEER